MDDEKTNLFFIFWKKSYIWSNDEKIRSDGKIELWKTMIERMGEDAKRNDDK